MGMIGQLAAVLVQPGENVAAFPEIRATGPATQDDLLSR